mmetsp:Transcript_1489/g.4834  ORF Transcript_1489/g.4834 Transcript_1489/m.4834 type:complete len:200 (+) Transcript_1489:1655-2254(+)
MAMCIFSRIQDFVAGPPHTGDLDRLSNSSLGGSHDDVPELNLLLVSRRHVPLGAAPEEALHRHALDERLLVRPPRHIPELFRVAVHRYPRHPVGAADVIHLNMDADGVPFPPPDVEGVILSGPDVKPGLCAARANGGRCVRTLRVPTGLVAAMRSIYIGLHEWCSIVRPLAFRILDLPGRPEAALSFVVHFAGRVAAAA